MSAKCKTEKELASAIERKEDYIEIEGNLAKKTIRIKCVGKFAWVVCGASLAAAIALYLATPEVTVVSAPVGGAGGAISFTGALATTTVAATSLGTATTTAIALGVAAGGIGAVNTLRDKYIVIENKGNYVKLKRK